MTTEPIETTETFQIPIEAAEAYEARFVPALFGEWAPRVVEAAGVAPRHRVLDVACGTGVVARAAWARLGGRGAVVGVDVNEAMLTVARRLEPAVDWRRGDAAALPCDAAAFDAVLCQSALMFFPDRTAALGEMARVCAPGGTVAVQVWSGLDEQPAYGPLVEVAARHAGREAVQMLSALRPMAVSQSLSTRRPPWRTSGTRSRSGALLACQPKRSLGSRRPWFTRSPARPRTPTMRPSFTAMSRVSPLECRIEALCTHRSTSAPVTPGSRKLSTRTGQGLDRPPWWGRRARRPAGSRAANRSTRGGRPYGVRGPQGSAMRSGTTVLLGRGLRAAPTPQRSR